MFATKKEVEDLKLREHVLEHMYLLALSYKKTGDTRYEKMLKDVGKFSVWLKNKIDTTDYSEAEKRMERLDSICPHLKAS